jgi:hypothetical protein
VSTLADLLIEIGIDSKGVDKGAGKVEGRMKKTWGGIKAGAAAGGLAAGAALMQGMQSIIETSKPVALLQAQLGATGEFAGEVGAAAGALYSRGVIGSMEEATGAIKAVWQNGLVPEDALQSDIEAVGASLSNLAAISEDEAGNVANAVKQMMRNGLVKNAQEGFDLLTRGVQKGINKAGDLFDTYNEYGTQFRKLGLDGATSMGLMNQAIRAGARDADTAADALKEFSIRAIDGSTASAAGFKALGLNAKDMTAQIAQGGPQAEAGLGLVLDKLKAMKDPVKQNAAAVALFGTKAEDLGKALFAMDTDTAADGLGKVAGAADKAGDTLENSAGAKLESFKRKAIGGLTEELAKALPAIEATFGWLSRNSDWVVPLATALGAVAVAIALVTAAQWAYNAALAASGVGVIVIAIGALIGFIIYLATQTQFFQIIWEKVWSFMKMVGAWFAGPFANFFVQLGNKIVGFAKFVWKYISMYFGFWFGLYAKIGTAIATFLIAIKNKFMAFIGFVRSIPGRVRASLSSMWDGLKSGFRSALNWVIGKWNGLHFSIPSFSILGKNFGGGSIGVPHIPQLADGGIVPARNGGTLVNVGEGGQDEAVVPLGRGPALGGAADRPVVIQIVPGGESEFRKWIKKSIRINGALAPSGAI